jgi:alpha-beta hydrolase superfamily lysophospholipase
MRPIRLSLQEIFGSGCLGIIFVTTLLIFLSACAPVLIASGEPIHAPQLIDKGFLTADGEILAVKSWGPKDNKAKAIIIALHGFNDYSNFFKAPGEFLAEQGILSYAFDQRGFGASNHPGVWAGTKTMVGDLKTFARLIKHRHKEIPLYLLGESMGGALIMVATTENPTLQIDGVILSAPAVWSRRTMPWYQRLALWIGARIMPSVTITGEGLNIKPSDNLEMLLALGRDPLVIKKTRVDTIYGLTNLMDTALERAILFFKPALILYGEKDEVIPLKPTHLMLKMLPQIDGKRHRLALYKDGYHMLLRDLNAKAPWRDIDAWITNNDPPFNSGADINAYERLSILSNKM